MVLAISELTSSYDNVDRTSYTIASVSPAASSLLILLYSTREGTTGPGATPANGFGGTWTEFTGAHQGDGISAIGGFYLQCSASPGSGTTALNIDGGVTAIGAAWHLLEVTGHDTSTPIVTAAVNYGPTGTTSGTAAPTSAQALGNANNAQILHHMHRGNSATTLDGGGGWTGGTDRAGSTPNHCQRVEWKIGSYDSSPTMTFTSVRWQTLYVEVAVAGNATAPLSTLTSTTALATITILASATAPIATLTSTTALATITVTGAAIAPLGLTSTTGLPAFTITAIQNATAPLATLTSTTALPAFTVSGAAIAPLATLSSTTELPAFTITAESGGADATAPLSTLTSTTGLPAFTIAAGAAAPLATLGVTTELPAIAASGAATAPLATLTSITGLPTVGISAGAVAALTTLTVTTNFPGLTVTGGATAPVGTITSGEIPALTVFTGTLTVVLGPLVRYRRPRPFPTQRPELVSHARPSLDEFERPSTLRTERPGVP